MFKERYYRNFNNLRFCRPVLLTGNFQLNLSQQEKWFKQRYYRIVNDLSLCRPVLVSGNVQSENVAEVEMLQTTILTEH